MTFAIVLQGDARDSVLNVGLLAIERCLTNAVFAGVWVLDRNVVIRAARPAIDTSAGIAATLKRSRDS